jgi:hypothetical protein
VTLSRLVSWPVVGVAAGLVGLLAWHRWSRTASTVTRWGARSRASPGVASSVDIARKASARAVRGNVATVRPSLAGLSWWRLRRTVPSEYALMLCGVGAQWEWSSIENVILVFGGPRMGKSGWLAGRIIDAPGAVVVTLDPHRPLRADHPAAA